MTIPWSRFAQSSILRLQLHTFLSRVAVEYWLSDLPATLCASKVGATSNPKGKDTVIRLFPERKEFY